MDKEVIIDGKKLKLTNLDKVFWPEEGYTKGELIEYYRSISKYILPHLKDRLQSLNRFPNGILGESFYQKNVEKHPDWVKTKRVFSESTGEYVNYVICNDEATLIYLINLGCIELNVLSSRINMLEYPDFLVIDLDPEDIDFVEVIKVAKEAKKVFDSLDIPAYIKTSGASGMHIFVPMGAKYTFSQVKDFAKIIAFLIHQKLPDITSLERRPEKRQKKVYLDYLQNNLRATMASVYSVRPKPMASVSMPLKWEELTLELKPTDFTIKNALRRIEKSDIFAPVLGQGIDLKHALEKINQLS